MQGGKNQEYSRMLHGEFRYNEQKQKQTQTKTKQD
jgi:hypothetical protein